MLKAQNYSHIRGIHLGFEESSLPLEKQLEYCQKLNLNSNRLFMDYWLYAKDNPENVKKKIRNIVRWEQMG